MKKIEFIALSACLMMLTALGIDIMLPAFGEIRTRFKLDAGSTATAQIVVLFLGQRVNPPQNSPFYFLETNRARLRNHLKKCSAAILP